MSDVNKAIIIGNLGKDPEVKFTTDGTPVCNFSIATNENWTKDGEKQKLTTWHRVNVWGKQAELCGQYLKKGRKVYVEGSIRHREYTDKEGVKKTAVEIRANDVRFLDSNREDTNDQQ